MFFPHSHLPVLELAYGRYSLHPVNSDEIRVHELLLLACSHYCPYVESPLADLHLKAFVLAIEEEVAIFAVVDFFRKECKQLTVKFELTTVLVPELVHAVKELCEDLSAIVQVTGAIVSTSFSKHVAKWAPVLLNQHLKAINCSVERIEEELDQGTQLRCAIPAIWTVDHNCVLLHIDALHDLVSC